MAILRSRRGLLAFVAIFITVAGLLLAAASNASASAGRYCAAQASPARGAAHLRCFRDFASSISYATGGKIHLAAAARSRSVSEAELRGATAATAAPNTTYVLSIDFLDANFQGNTFTWFGNSPCGFYANQTMASGWNDQVSSVATYSGCATTLFWDANFGRPTYPIGVDASVGNLGAFNDKTSSQKWCPSYPCG
jgi:hypothetical protein